MRYAKRRPTPWSFHAAKYGLRNVVVDADQEPIASNVPPGSGALLAAGPDLLEALQTVAREAQVGTLAWHTATDAIEAERVLEHKSIEGSEQAVVRSFG